MLEVIQKILESPAGSFSFILSIMLFVGWAIHYVTKFATKISERHNSLEKQVDKTETNIDAIKKEVIKIDVLGSRLDRVDSRLDRVESDISDMKVTLRLALDNIVPYAKKKSPLVLNEEGEKLVSEHNFDAMINDNWSKINNAIQNLGTKHPYDIQKFCFDTAYEDTNPIRTAIFITAKDIDKLKTLSFKSGVHIYHFAQVIGILIRDRYFAENGIDM